jgi:hypothetical protein
LPAQGPPLPARPFRFVIFATFPQRRTCKFAPCTIGAQAEEMMMPQLDLPDLDQLEKSQKEIDKLAKESDAAVKEIEAELKAIAEFFKTLESIPESD